MPLSLTRPGLALAVLLSAVPVAAEAGRPEGSALRRIRFYVGADYFTPGNAERGARKTHRDELRNFGKKGYDTRTAGADATSAMGVRAGFLYPLKSVRGLSLGASAGYVEGPTVRDRVEATHTANNFYADCKYEQSSRLTRVMGEASKSFTIKGYRSFIGAGLGMARGHVHHEGSLLLTDPSEGGSRYQVINRSWSGLTWELNAGVLIPIGSKYSLMVGPRYSEFPTLDVYTSVGPPGLRNFYFRSFAFNASLVF